MFLTGQCASTGEPPPPRLTGEKSRRLQSGQNGSGAGAGPRRTECSPRHSGDAWNRLRMNKLCAMARCTSVATKVSRRDDLVGVAGATDPSGRGFQGVVFDDVEQLQPAIIGGLVELEVESPEVVGLGREQLGAGFGR